MTTTMTTPEAINPDVPIDFCTLGMFIIDEIHPSPTSADQTVHRDVIGGAGTYSALGARLFSPAPERSRSVAWIVDAGPDFPAAVHATITSWSTSAWIRPRADGGPTTRGWNGYSGNEQRAFAYVTPKNRLTAKDLPAAMLRSRSFHLICGAERCVDQVTRILAGREKLVEGEGQEGTPVVVWEPVPDLCTPDALEGTYAALAHVDVVSPNHAELGALFGFTHGDERVAKEVVEQHALKLVEHGIGRQGKGAVVVRAGAEGCFVLTPTVKRWLPAFHDDVKRVVDPTGGGNGFLGGFAVGLVRNGGDVVEAARWGSVAASFTIEQVGMPLLNRNDDTTGVEEWNGVNVFDRLIDFQKRTQ